MKYKVLIIANLKAGRAKIGRYIPTILKNLRENNYDTTVLYTTLEKSGTQLVMEYKDPFDIVLVAGGDGTLNEVVDGLYRINSEAFIGIIPCGTTNDFAKSLYLYDDYTHLAKNINKYNSFKADMGIFNDKIFNYTASFGLFSKTSYYTSREMKNRFGRKAYIWSGFKEFLKIKTYKLNLYSDEKNVEGEFFYGSISNTRNIGGFRIFKKNEISVSDGKFEVILIKKTKNFFTRIFLFLKMISGNLKDKNIIFFQTSNLNIEFEEPTPFSLDGEEVDDVKDVFIINKKEYNNYIIPEESNLFKEEENTVNSFEY